MRRRADVAFPLDRIAVFVDGCFWHGCPEHGTSPKANAEWWRAKIDANKERDRQTNVFVVKAGWVPVRVWEHEDPAAAAERIALVVLDRRSAATP